MCVGKMAVQFKYKRLFAKTWSSN